MKGNRSIDNNEFGRIRCMSNKRIKKYKSKAHGFGLFVCICIGKRELMTVQNKPTHTELLYSCQVAR